MGISVVITHYAPPTNSEYFQKVLVKTIESVRSQNINFEVEIIICDDGSPRLSFLGSNENEIIDLSKLKIKQHEALKGLEVDRYLYINSGNKYYRSRLMHRAYSTTQYKKIVALDDDNPFILKDSLARYDKYLTKYEFVRGRIISANGIPQLYSTTAVQGTNLGFKKDVYKQIGGLGNYLFEGLSGADDDLTWQIYNYLKTTFPNKKKACYAGDIMTRDLLNGRWVNNSYSTSINAIENHVQRKDEINRLFNLNFIKEYGINPINNPSRDKKLWMEFPSMRSVISEIYYLPIHYYKTFPIKMNRKIKRFKKFVKYCSYKEGRLELRRRFSKHFIKIHSLKIKG